MCAVKSAAKQPMQPVTCRKGPSPGRQNCPLINPKTGQNSTWAGLPSPLTLLLDLTDLDSFRGATLTAFWPAITAVFVTTALANLFGSTSISSLTASPVNTHGNTINTQVHSKTALAHTGSIEKKTTFMWWQGLRDHVLTWKVTDSEKCVCSKRATWENKQDQNSPITSINEHKVESTHNMWHASHITNWIMCRLNKPNYGAWGQNCHLLFITQ